MKINLVKLMTLLLITVTWSVSAQNRSNNGAKGTPQYKGFDYCKAESAIPDLSDAQKEKIEQLRIKHLAEVKDLKNQMMEKKAHLKTLTDKANPDLKEIEKVLAEQQAIQKKLYMKGIEHRSAVRALLTDKQKAYWDALPRGPKAGKGRGQGSGRGAGCNGQGRPGSCCGSHRPF